MRDLIIVILCTVLGRFTIIGSSRHQVTTSKSGYNISPWSRDRVITEAKKVYSDVDDIRYNVIINGITEKSYTGKFVNGERYNIKQDGVYVGGNSL